MTFTDTCMEMEALMTLPTDVQLTGDDRERLDAHLAECAGCFASAAEVRAVGAATAPSLSASPRRWWIAAASLVAAAALVSIIVLQRPSGGQHMEHAHHNYTPPVNKLTRSGGPGVVNVPIKYGKQLQVVAVLESLPKGFDCGYMMFIGTARYRVTRVVSGHYPHKTLYVHHICPELSSPPLKAGRIYSLSVDRSRPRAASKVQPLDTFADKLLPRYWHRSLTRVQPGAEGAVTKRVQLKPTSRVTIMGRAVEVTPPGPACGVLAVAQRARYRVVRVLKGRYPHKYVDVILPCSNVSSGSYDRLELGPRPKQKFSWSITGDLSKPAAPVTYWMTRRSKP